MEQPASLLACRLSVMVWSCLAEAKATEPMAVAAGSTEVAMALVTWGQVMAAKMEA
jgi:hypothetical protein